MSGSTFNGSISGHYTIPAPQASHGGTINFNFDGRSSKESQPRAPFSTVPFLPDQGFVERPRISAWLRDKCEQPGSRAALIGLGGVGKSQLAIQHAHHVRQQSPSTYVFWVHAGTRLRFEEAYRGIADRLRLPGHDDPKTDVLRLVYNWLCSEENGKWLIIVDNADDINVFYPSGLAPLAPFLPQTRNGRIIFTSRSRDAAERLTGSSWNVLSVSAMNDDQAKQLLRTKLRDKYDEVVATSLVHALECMPLAITHAAAYILRRAPRMSPSKYLDEFRKSDEKKASLLNRDTGDLRRDPSATNSVVTTWQITFEQIQKERRSAADLLSFMSLFNPQGIPEWVLRSYQRSNLDQVIDAHGNMPGHERGNVGIEDRIAEVKIKDETGDNESEYGSGDDKFEYDMEILRGYSLVTVQEDVYEMHALVQLCTRVWLSDNGIEKWRRQFLQVMSREHPTGVYENWVKCQQLEPHIEHIIETEPTNKDDAEAWMELVANVGWYRGRTGRHGAAEMMLKKVVIMSERDLGPDHHKTLQIVSNIASVMQNQARYEEAEQMTRRVISGREKALGKYHPDTLTSLSNLASVLRRRGKYEEAEQVSRQALNAREETLGKDHPHTLKNVSKLASILLKRGKYEEAEQMMRRAVSSNEAAFGKDHPDTLMTVHNLAVLLQYQGNNQEAEQMYRRVFSGSEKALGKDHPYTLTSLSSLASVLQNQKKYEESEQLYQRVLSGHEAVLGKDHPSTLVTVHNLATVLRDRGNYQEAERMHQWVISSREKVLGKDHPDTLRSVYFLAFLYQRQKRWEEAEELYQRAYNGLVKALGPDHPSTRSCEGLYASLKKVTASER